MKLKLFAGEYPGDNWHTADISCLINSVSLLNSACTFAPSSLNMLLKGCGWFWFILAVLLVVSSVSSVLHHIVAKNSLQYLPQICIYYHGGYFIIHGSAFESNGHVHCTLCLKQKKNLVINAPLVMCNCVSHFTLRTWQENQSFLVLLVHVVCSAFTMRVIQRCCNNRWICGSVSALCVCAWNSSSHSSQEIMWKYNICFSCWHFCLATGLSEIYCSNVKLLPWWCESILHWINAGK